MRADRKHEPRENEERWNTTGSFGLGRAREGLRRRGLQAQWLWRPGSLHEQRLPAYSQPSLEVITPTVERVDFFSLPRHDGGDRAR